MTDDPAIPSTESAADSVAIRTANAADREAFVEQRIALLSSLGELAAGADIDRLRRETRAAFDEGLASGDAVAWLAVDGAGLVLGSAVLLAVRRFPSLQNPSRREGYLAHMYVRPEARRSGIGSALLEAAVRESRRRGLLRLRLHSTAEGRELYDRCGFRLRTNDMELFLDGA